ncbi:AEC family transporter [Pseudorhodoferax sp. Leaf274]|uniref:AEC family transporter n=1 Tax=Pseudorhodoferax sp. Leaf274 TaxID=1736318 RepID=UPI0007037C6A|nr:AEC family transporter [Pseudorhodoferax sp. Leaf274]KQP49897.1 transporter [Pseudorhodoferax sp. Leaf274]
MLAILSVTFPFFALILAGYVAARRRLLPLDAIPGLNGFVLFFALPCMLYRFGASTPLALLLDPVLAAVYTLCALVLVVGVVAADRRRLGWNDAALGALVAAFPNSGFMGVPLLVALLGASAAGPVMLTLVVDLLLTTSLCVALSRLDAAGAAGARQALARALQGVARNPMPWSIVLGMACQAFGVQLWQPLDATVALLAAAASPVALFTIGAVLARSQMLASRDQDSDHGQREHRPVPWREVLPVVVLKLFAHPLLVWGAGMGAMALGLPITPFSLTAMVLAAALPSASNVSLLAERFGANNGRIARIILWSTAAAFFTFSAAVALLR